MVRNARVDIRDNNTAHAGRNIPGCLRIDAVGLKQIPLI